MNPRLVPTISSGSASIGLSEFDRELAHAKSYFGDEFPGNEGITCLKCGAAVNHGWTHIAWHEDRA